MRPRTRRPRIVLVGAGPIQQFATSYRCLALARCLVEDYGAEAHFVVAAHAADQRLYGAEFQGVRLHYIADLPIWVTGWRFDPQLLMRTLVRIWRRLTCVLRLRPQLVHVFKPLPETLLTGFILKCLGYRVVLDEDDADADMMAAAGRATDAWRYGLTVALSRMSHRLCHRVTVASRAFERLYRRRGHVAAYVPNGIFSREFRAHATPLHRPGRTVTALYLGALEKCFDADLAIEAFARAYRQVDSLRLLVVGDGPLRAELQERTSALGCAHAVTFVGRVPKAEVIAWLSRAHIFLFPMRDNWINRCRCPLKLREFAAMGRPIVAPAFGEVLEVVPKRQNLVPANAGPVQYGDRLADLARSLLSGQWQASALPSPSQLDWRQVAHTLAQAYVSVLPCEQAFTTQPR